MKVFLICLPKLHSLIVIHLKFEVYTLRYLHFNTSKPEKMFLPHKKHVVYITEINWLILSGEMVVFLTLNRELKYRKKAVHT